MAKLARTRRPRLTPAVMRRALMADRWVPRLVRAIRLALDRQVREVAKEARIGVPPGQEPHVLSWAQELENAERPWMIAMAAEGYELAGTEFGLKGAWVASKATVDPVTAGVGASFLQVGDYAGIDRWVATTAAGSAATTAKKLEDVYKDAVASRDPKTGRAWTNREIAKEIERKGLASNPARSLMLARTGSIWAMNEGAHQRYKRMGVTVEKWITTVDDARCPFCAQMHGRAVRTDDPFWKRGSEFGVQVPKIGGGLSRRTLKMPFEVQHPPLHPNCRCTMVPVITQEQAAAITPPVPRKPKPLRKPRVPKEPTVPAVARPIPPKPAIVAEELDTATAYREALLRKSEIDVPSISKLSQEEIAGLQIEVQEIVQLAERATTLAEKRALRKRATKLGFNINGNIGDKLRITARLDEQYKLLLEPTKLSVKPVGIDVTPAIEKQVKKELDFVRRALRPSVARESRQPLGQYYLRGIKDEKFLGSYQHGRTGVMNVSEFGGSGNTVHEFGHRLESIIPDWRKKAKAFRTKRAAGARIKKLPKFSGDVKGYKDRFDNPYAGRVYDTGETEIISVGMEALYKNPLKFAKKDPEYFDFIVGLLKGIP